MACRRDPRRAVHVPADVALVRHDRRPGVDAHADGDRGRGQRLLGLPRRVERPRRGRERVEERVALGVDLDAAEAPEDLPEDVALLAEDSGVALVAELVEEARRALDVREEKRHRAARELRHGATSV